METVSALRCFAVLVLVSSPAFVLASSLFSVASLVADGETCPDKRVCPSGDTCCQLAGGDYGCCQLHDAVCCSDKKSCCPSGTTCNLEKGTCDQVPRSAKPSAIPTVAVALPPSETRAPDAPCPCSSSQTCCLTPGLVWTCCPMPNASCCPDGLYCCRYGTHCMNDHCYSEDAVATWMTIISSRHSQRQTKL